MSDVENGSENTTPEAITSLTVKGFKSLARETSIDIRPLTLLAGANSSGKSSAMQPLLLMKQTLEAPFDPGPLLLDGANVSFRNQDELFSRFTASIHSSRKFSFKASIQDESSVSVFKKGWNGIDLHAGSLNPGAKTEITIRPSSTYKDFKRESPGAPHGILSHIVGYSYSVLRNKNVLTAAVKGTFRIEQTPGDFEDEPYRVEYSVPTAKLRNAIQSLIHVPGLRDNPSRTYKTTAVSDRFPGTFDTYVASVIQSWQREDDARLPALVEQLRHMGLTRDVSAERINDTQVELRVAQEPIGSGGDARMINVADVGIGVSQVLPVLVAMLVADPGQLVYIEQPEIHLHPRAQARLADAIIEASNRGVRVVIETHSQLLLLAIQTRIAENEIDPEKVMLHWFTRDEQGVTSVASREPDEKGAFGDWPEDFSEVEMEWQNRYLDAAEKHLFG